MRLCWSLITLIFLLIPAPSQIAVAQTNVSNTSDSQPALTTSSTYADTLAALKDFDGDSENSAIARLFAVGDLRTDDLLTACRSGDEEVSGIAFLTLQLLGKPQCRECFDSFRTHDYPSVFSCGGPVSEDDYLRIEKWRKKKPTCKRDQCNEKNTQTMEDGLLYALILDGSPKVQSVLNRVLQLEKATGVHDTVVAETLSKSKALIGSAHVSAHDLKLEPATLEKTICESAFFLPSEHGDDCNVQLLARNSTNDRVLVEVSYHCGRLCGRGYYVVLRKDRDVWQYALIRMAWIS